MWIYIWLGVTALSLIIEFLTTEMVTIWFAGAGLVSMILAIFNVGWYITLPLFIVLSFLCMLIFRKMIMKRLGKDKQYLNADNAIGKDYTLLTPIGFNVTGTIKINDVVWNVKTENEEDVVSAGEKVRVLRLEGNKYIVKKI